MGADESLRTTLMTTTLREKAMDYLSRREHSRLELKKKLLSQNSKDSQNPKNFSESDIDGVLQQLAAENLQSDVRFAESYVRSRKLAGFGPKRIEMELHERGVMPAVIADILNSQASEWYSQMVAVWQKKFAGSFESSGSLKNRQQQFRFLFYRGYTSEAILQLLNHENFEGYD